MTGEPMRAIPAALTMAVVLALGVAPANAQQGVRVAHGIAIHGEPEYPADFNHLKYVNPHAPKGGTVRLSAFGTYDSLNPYILKGQPAAGLGNVFERLMDRTLDEANTEYALIAQSIETPPDRSWAEFTLDPNARWHDGKPITAEDVIWTFETIKTKGHPFYRAYTPMSFRPRKLVRARSSSPSRRARTGNSR